MIDRLPAVAGRLAAVFRRAGFTVEGVAEALGAEAGAALDRGEPEPARRCLGSGGEDTAGSFRTLVRLFLLGETVPAEEVAAAFAPVDLDDLLDADLLRRGPDGVAAGLDRKSVV